MNINRKNKKTLISVVSTMTVAVLILTGTFAWSTIQQAITGGRNETLEYVVMLLDVDNPDVYEHNNWVTTQKLNKPVYASSKYEADSKVKAEYDRITDLYEDDEPPVFSDTWVRIKLEETFIKNGAPLTETVTKIDDGKLVSSFTEDDGGYFELVNNDTNTVIKEIADWTGEHGRFWILDIDGWMYWAQPLLAPTEGSTSPDQETDHLIDEVKLTKQPSGTWEYTITATLDAMDVELVGYESEGAWSDVTSDKLIHQLFERADADAAVAIYINEKNFPDVNFRTYLLTGIGTATGFDDYLTEYVTDKKLTMTEIAAITKIDIYEGNLSTLEGIEYFTELTYLHLGYNKLSILDVSNNNKLEKLYVFENKLTSIILGSQPALNTLWVYDNQLSSLDISGIPEENKENWDFNYDDQKNAHGGEKTLKTDPVNKYTQILIWE